MLFGPHAMHRCAKAAVFAQTRELETEPSAGVASRTFETRKRRGEPALFRRRPACGRPQSAPVILPSVERSGAGPARRPASHNLSVSHENQPRPVVDPGEFQRNFQGKRGCRRPHAPPSNLANDIMVANISVPVLASDGSMRNLATMHGSPALGVAAAVSHRIVRSLASPVQFSSADVVIGATKR